MTRLSHVRGLAWHGRRHRFPARARACDADAGHNGSARIEAALDYLHGRVLLTGEVVANDVAYRDGFDVGRVVVGDASRQTGAGRDHEFMTDAAAYPEIEQAMGSALMRCVFPEAKC